MSTCPLCGVVPADYMLHLDYHRASHLHGPKCAKLVTANKQRTSGVYFEPPPCDCGLE